MWLKCLQIFNSLLAALNFGKCPGPPGVRVDVEEHPLAVLHEGGDVGRRRLVLDGGDLDVGVLVRDLRQRPKHELGAALMVLAGDALVGAPGTEGKTGVRR